MKHHHHPAVSLPRPRVLGLAGVSALLLGAAGLARATVVPPTDNVSAPFMGIYANPIGASDAGDGVSHADFTAGWLYRSKLHVMEFTDKTWAAIEGDPAVLRTCSLWLAANPGGKLLFVPSMLPASGYTLAAGASASGPYDSHFTTLATNLVSWGLADSTIIRLGHEFNGTWYSWKVGNATDAANFAAYYRRIVNAMRAVPGAANLKFEWCGAMVWTSYPISAAYPGNAYVDYIGVDVYDRCYDPNTYPLVAGETEAQTLTRRQNAWTAISGNTNNHIGVWKSFAVAQGKPFVIPEWGVSGDPTSDGLDNPYFIQKMYEFIHDPANGVYYHGYFDNQPTDGHHRLTNLPDASTTEFPLASAEFRRLFGLPPFPLNNDIGSVGIAGSGKVEDFVGAGLGFRAGATSDAFHLASRSVAGDDDLRLKITTTSSASGAQAGAMLRQSTATNAAYAALALVDGKCVFQVRSAAGAAAAQTASVVAPALPVWLRLQRRGTQVTGYLSSDGLNWLRVDTKTLALTGAANLGAAVSSGTSTASNSVVIADVDRVDFAVSGTASVQNAIILDNDAASGVAQTGTWSVSTSSLDRQGANYLTDGNAGKGAKTVRYSPALPAAGTYDVHMRWPTASNRSHATPVTVSYQGGSLSLIANQQSGHNLWNHLGAFSFAAGNTGNVLVGNTGTTLYVMADAVMFTPLPVPAVRSPLADAHVQDGTYASTNFGTEKELWVKSDVSPNNRNTFLRFDVSGLAAAKLAMLELTPAVVGPGVGALYTVEFVSSDTWTESGITWATKPAASGVSLGQISNLQAGVPVAIDITSRVRTEAAANGLLSVRIYSAVSGTDKYATFGSREHDTTTWRPRLLTQ